MKTAKVILHTDEVIELNEKFLPGLIAGCIIYYCDEHKAYHLSDDIGETRALAVVHNAARNNNAVAWEDGKPLNPECF